MVPSSWDLEQKLVPQYISLREGVEVATYPMKNALSCLSYNGCLRMWNVESWWRFEAREPVDGGLNVIVGDKRDNPLLEKRQSAIADSPSIKASGRRESDRSERRVPRHVMVEV